MSWIESSNEHIRPCIPSLNRFGMPGLCVCGAVVGLVSWSSLLLLLSKEKRQGFKSNKQTLIMEDEQLIINKSYFNNKRNTARRPDDFCLFMSFAYFIALSSPFISPSLHSSIIPSLTLYFRFISLNNL